MSQSTMRAPQLRVIHPDEVDESPDRSEPLRPTSNWTLIDFYAYWLKPKCRRWPPHKAEAPQPTGKTRRTKPADAETVKQDEIALWRWWQAMTGWTDEAVHEPDPEKALRYAESQRPEPRLAQITDETCDGDFLDYADTVVYRGKAVSDQTIRKWVRTLNYMLVRTGPRLGAKKHFAHVVAEAPQIEPPCVEEGGPKPAYSLAQIWELIQTCEGNDHALPQLKWRPQVWWPAVIRFDYNTAMRPETLFQFRWEHFVSRERLVAEFGSERLARDDLPPLVDRVLDLPSEILKGRTPRRQKMWLNDAAYRAIRPLKRPAGPVFGWPWPTAKSTLHHEIQRLLRLAGLPELSFKGLRRAFATQCLRIDHALTPLACDLTMNHHVPQLDVVLRHYAGPVKIMTDILPDLRQPGPAHQRRLF